LYGISAASGFTFSLAALLVHPIGFTLGIQCTVTLSLSRLALCCLTLCRIIARFTRLALLALAGTGTAHLILGGEAGL
jgi:hypothetical protein